MSSSRTKEIRSLEFLFRFILLCFVTQNLIRFTLAVLGSDRFERISITQFKPELRNTGSVVLSHQEVLPFESNLLLYFKITRHSLHSLHCATLELLQESGHKATLSWIIGHVLSQLLRTERNFEQVIWCEFGTVLSVADCSVLSLDRPSRMAPRHLAYLFLL